MVNIVKITDECVLLSNGVNISSYHEQDCCERVYADWEGLLHAVDDIGGFHKITFLTVQNIGVMLEFYHVHDIIPKKVLVNCYDDQNGYYSSELLLNVKFPNGAVIEFDITNCSFIVGDKKNIKDAAPKKAFSIKF